MVKMICEIKIIVSQPIQKKMERNTHFHILVNNNGLRTIINHLISIQEKLVMRKKWLKKEYICPKCDKKIKNSTKHAHNKKHCFEN